MTRTGILIVASDRGVREAFVAALAARGWADIETCESVAEAVRVLVRAGFGVAVVHAAAADMTGIQAVPVIRAADEHVKIVFATPASTAELEARVRDAGVYYYYVYEEGEVDELAAVVAEAVGPPRTPATRKTSVLVVDDDADFRESVMAVLSRRGFTVAGAATAEEGLELARALHPDVVLLDVMLETATDGCLFSRQLRQDPRLKHTPILAVSSSLGQRRFPFSPREDEDMLPVDGFVSKPIEIDTLVRLVEELAGGRKQP
ncbi:MAG TPA: response regulator [Thermoanaerobaculaceae bacterium]|nr:response regulator [Thermoanaerobaculaceae bacterium]HRS16009.1 response regulator [Thermoanaerobaculaceae bacterium]